MPQYRAPGVYIEEIPSGVRAIVPRSPDATLFIDLFGSGLENTPKLVTSAAEATEAFGASAALDLYFANGGRRAIGVRASDDSDAAVRTALGAADSLDEEAFDLICVPFVASMYLDVWERTVRDVIALAAKRRAFVVLDAPIDVNSPLGVSDLTTLLTVDARNAAVYAPRVVVDGTATAAAPAVAGVYRRTDAAQGVWKAPAGLEAGLYGITGLEVSLSRHDADDLNRSTVNPLVDHVPGGPTVWGARTLASDPEWKYVSVRRTALLIEASLESGLQWVVFEPNDEPLWAGIREAVEGFLQGLWREGAFPATAPREAFFVRCDRTTTTQPDLVAGRVRVIVGFAPLKPAEFVVIQFTFPTAS